MDKIAMDEQLKARLMSSLGRTTLFTSLNNPQLAGVATRASVEHFEDGEELAVQGEEADCFFVVLDGKVSVSLSIPGSEKELVLAHLGKDEMVGEMGLLLETRRSATVRAVGSVTAARYSASTFRVMFDVIQDFGWSVSQALARRLHNTLQQIPLADLGRNEIRGQAEGALDSGSFNQLQRVVALNTDEEQVLVGFVDEPSSELLERICLELGNRAMRAVRLGPDEDEEAAASGDGEEE